MAYSRRFLFTKSFLASVFLLASSLQLPTVLHAEDVKITTYYPSPYGSYKQVQVQNQDDSATLTDFTQGLIKAGINIITDYTDGSYTPGIFWSTIAPNNPDKPKAGIWMYEATAGTKLYFGTSNSPGTGITNSGMVLDQDGDLGIGGVTDPQSRLHASATDAATNTFTTVLTLNHSTTGTPAAGFGTGLVFQGESTTTENLNMARIQSNWTDPAHATRTSSLYFQTVDSGTIGTKMVVDGKGRVGVGTSAPHEDAVLDLTSTTGGLIPPRMTTAERNRLSDSAYGSVVPPNGTIIYNTVGKLQIRRTGGWDDLYTGTGGAYCTTVKTTVADVGYFLVNLNDPNNEQICADGDGCTFRLWSYTNNADGSPNVNDDYFDHPVLLIHDYTSDLWFFSYLNIEGKNGSGDTTATQMLSWGSAFVYDDSPAGDGIGEQDWTQIVFRDNSASTGYIFSVCDV